MKSVVGGGWLLVVSKGDWTADTSERFCDSMKANKVGHEVSLTESLSRESVTSIVNYLTKSILEEDSLNRALSLRFQTLSWPITLPLSILKAIVVPRLLQFTIQKPPNVPRLLVSRQLRLSRLLRHLIALV